MSWEGRRVPGKYISISKGHHLETFSTYFWILSDSVAHFSRKICRWLIAFDPVSVVGWAYRLLGAQECRVAVITRMNHARQHQQGPKTRLIQTSFEAHAPEKHESAGVDYSVGAAPSDMPGRNREPFSTFPRPGGLFYVLDAFF